MDALHVGPAVDDGDCRDDALDARIECPDDERMPAAVRDAPYADSFGIDALEGFRVADGAAVVLDLVPRVEVLTRCAVARSKSAIVEHQCGAAGPYERVRVVRLHELLHVAPAARHHDDRQWTLRVVRPVEVPPNGHTFALKLHVLAHSHSPFLLPALLPEMQR